MTNYLKLCWLIAVFFVQISFGQNPYYQTIDKSSGLPSNSVYDVFQDKDGFMWFATGKGLSRYDGSSIKTYTADFQTAKSGSCIQQDKYGRIWYENFDGFIYYVENQQLKSLSQSKPIGYYRYGIIDDHLLVLQADGVQYYDLKTLKPITKTKMAFSVLKFSYCTNDKLYVFDKQLYEFNKNGASKSYALPENFDKQFSSPIVQKTLNGFVVFSKYTSDYCYFDNGNFTQKHLDIPIEFIQNIASAGNCFWLCTTKGIVRFNPKTNSSENFFTDKNISFIYADRQQNYWVSTINEGVHFIENFDTKIIALPSKPVILSKKENTLLAGTDNDMLFEINPEKQTNDLVYKGNISHGINQLFYDKSSKNTILTSSKLKIINGVSINEPQLGAVKDIVKIDNKYFSYAASNVSGIFTNRPDLKSTWDFTLDEFQNLQNDNFISICLIGNSNGKATAFNAKNNTIYYATNNGLIAFDKNGKTEIKHKNNTLYLTRLFEYNGNIYGYSNNEKIYVVNSKNEISAYDLPKSLAKESVERIDVEDHFLFVFTSNAIYEIDLDTSSFRKIMTLTKDIDITDIKLLDEQIYFASSKGIIVKNKIANAKVTPPKLFIDAILVNDNSSVSGKNTVLKYNQNDIKINFTVLSFVPNEKYEVLYSINNSRWNKLNAENRSLILSSLAPGDYKILFKIDAENNNTIKHLHFSIEDPFWKRAWFIVLVSLLIAYAIHLFYKRRITKIEHKNQRILEKVALENSLNQSKIKAIKSQMNPHFFYNALNTLQSYILSNDKKSAIDYLSKFSSLTRTILEMTEKENISIAEEIKTLNLYLELEKARFDEDFEFEITVKQRIDSEQAKIPTMLLQPFVENAVKHGLLHKSGLKTLKIAFEENEQYLVISIDDNGIGRKKSGELNQIKNKNHVSFSTKAIEHKIELLNKNRNTKISISHIDKTNLNHQATGTTVLIEIPK